MSDFSQIMDKIFPEFLGQECLYQYRGINEEYTWENIEKSNLVFNNIADLNDPTEGFHKCALEYFFGDKLGIKGECSLDDRLSQVMRYKITCFSKDPLNLLMWSHYADKHRGYVSIYAVNDIKKINLCHFFDVDYDCYSSGGHPVVKKADDLSEILKYKSYRWRYEQEVRAVIKSVIERDSISASDKEQFDPYPFGDKQGLFIKKGEDESIRSLNAFCYAKGDKCIRISTPKLEMRTVSPLGFMMGCNIEEKNKNRFIVYCERNDKFLYQCVIDGLNELSFYRVV